MIDFFFGKPRTGKSYRAVKTIYDEYLYDIEKGNIPKYKNILTNIGGFNFELVNKKFIDNCSSSLAYKLVWTEFYSRLKALYEMAKAEKSDSELNKYADYHHINDCSIFLDEASLYLKKYDEVLSWYFAYHGHFRVRLVIIAQSPKQIYSEYMEHTEIYYEAQPQSKQLTDSSLRYIHYSGLPFNKDSKFSSSSIKTDPKIYELYKSGEIDKPKKIIYKFIGYIIAAVLFVFLVSKYFVDQKVAQLNPNQIDESSPVSHDAPSVPSSASSSVFRFDSNSIFIRVRCDDVACARIDPAVQIQYIPKLYFDESLKSFSHSLVASASIDLLGVSYTDRLYIISKDYLSALGVWSIPVPTVSSVSTPPVNSVVGGAQ